MPFSEEESVVPSPRVGLTDPSVLWSFVLRFLGCMIKNALPVISSHFFSVMTDLFPLQNNLYILLLGHC